MADTVCSDCGTIQTVGPCAYYDALWSLYYRRKDGRQNIEPLVYSQEDVEDDPNWYYDRENSGPWLAMGNNMAQRGLCPTCGMPDLRGMNADDFYDEEEMQEIQEMWAEQAAERRMGC